jgi:hypothetical protein
MEALERLKIYEQMLLDFALTTLEERRNAGSHFGFCAYLMLNYGEVMHLTFHEIFSQKPLSVGKNAYWFPTIWWDETLGPDYPRLEIIKIAIEQVKQQL